MNKLILIYIYFINLCNSFIIKSPIIIQKNTTIHYGQYSLIKDCVKFPILDCIKDNYKHVSLCIILLLFNNKSKKPKKTIYRLKLKDHIYIV